MLSAIGASAQLVADGATNVLNNVTANLGSTNLVVGTNSPNTFLLLTNGSRLTNGFAYIGLNSGSGNNQVVLTGSNAAWVNNGDLYVGNFGASNTVNVTNGAAVQAANAYVGAEASSLGNSVSVGGGSLTVTNLGGTGVVDVRRGAVLMNGGSVIADRLLLTNVLGSWVFNSGNLVTRNALISNGQAFVVGANAGSGAATWTVLTNAAPTRIANELILGSGVANALSFSGVNQYVAVSNFGAIAPTNEVTVEFWAFANSNAEHSVFMAEPDETTNRFNGHINFIDGVSYWDFGNASNANARIAYPNPPGSISNWIHYALVASQTSNYMRIYRNGVLATNRPGMTPFQARAQELRIGGSTGFFFRGRIDEFRVWNVARSPADIQSNFSRVLNGNEPNLLLYYRFDSTNGTVATNSAAVTGPAYNGTLVNGPAWIPSGAFQTVVANMDQASLLITNGGRLEVVGNSLVGNTASASNNFAVVSGPNSTWTNSGGLFVGASSSFNSLIISNGGTVASSSGTIGLSPGANQNRAIVGGVNSTWSSGSSVDVGTFGNGNLLLITNGGFVTNVTATIGVNAGANDNHGIIAGGNSVWASSTLNVGLSGFSNRLTILSGGRSVNGATYIGYSLGATNNQITVDGSGSLLTNSADLYVGLFGSFNTLLVTNGGRAENRLGYVGYGASVKGNRAIVTGANAAWNNSSELQVGNASAGNSLLIANGGHVTSSLGIIGNSIGASNNQVTVTDTGSRWDNSTTLQVGNFGASNRLVIGNGGQVADDVGYVGYAVDSSNNQVIVTGTNSMWTNRGSLSIGFESSGNALLISNAARVVNGDGFIGFNTGANSNQVIAHGTNTLWVNSGDLYMGNFGAANTLRVANGAMVQSANAYLGGNGGATGNLLALLDGAFVVTNSGGNGLFDIRRGRVTFDGGAINVDRLLLTNAAGSFIFNSGTLTTRVATINNGQDFIVGAAGNLAPAIWVVRSNAIATTVANGLILGADGANGRLLLTNGGTLQVGGTSTVGQSGSAADNLVIVSGAGSFWNTSGFLYVGFDGPGNGLIITNRGRVQSDFGVIGYSSGGGNSNQVTVTGANSSWTNVNGLYVGDFGSGNALHIANGGSVRTANLYVGADVSSSGNLLDVANGTLTVSNATATGELDVRNGSAVVNGGTINVDRLLLTNVGGALAFNSGAINVRVTAAANGAAFVVGDGTSAAIYRLNSAVTNAHDFADGLIIASNAVLTGNGTLNGAVTNFGTISPGNSAGSLRINGSLSLASSAKMSFEIGGLIATNQYDQMAVTNFVQFAGTLSLALINGFSPAPGDAFTLMSFGSRIGTFTNAINGAVVATADRQRQFTVTYSATNLVVSNFEQSLLLTSIAPTSTNVTVRFRSIVGRSYQMQYSATLTNWTSVVGAAFTSPQPGITQWIDDGTLTGGLAGARFYRVLQLP